MSGLLYREFIFIARHKGLFAYSLCLFLLACFIMGLSLGNRPLVLRACGVGVLWSFVMIIMGIHTLQQFDRDFQEGILDDCLVQKIPLTWLVLIRWLFSWLMIGVPCLLAMPLVGLLFYQDMHLWLGETALRFLVGSLWVSLLMVIGGSLTFRGRAIPFLSFFLVMPLCIPIIIGVTAPQEAHFFWMEILASMLLLLAPFGVIGAGYALTFHVKR